MLRGGYNSLIYSDEPTQPYHDWRVQGLTLGSVAAVGGLGAYAATRQLKDDTRFVDHISAYARTVGNLSPFQLLNTFRAPEWLSPFTSEKFQLGNNPAGYSIGSSFLESAESYNYIKQLSGMSDAQLSQAGITPKMIGGPGQTASELLFERASPQDITGSLYSVVDGKRHLLSNNTMMFKFTGETPSLVELSTKELPVNRAVKSIFGAMDMWGKGGWGRFGENKLFARREEAIGVLRPDYIPVPGFAPTQAGTSYVRAFSAFGMERFNQLLTNAGHELLGRGFTDTLSKLGGARPDVLPGPGSHMFARFGMKMGGLVGAGLLLSESDWVRRQAGMPGHAAVSAGVGFGIGALATRAGLGPRAGLFAGLAAFAGQMIMPGFDQGIMPGIASTYTMAREWRATAINPMSYYRRTLEGFLPGISGGGVGVLAGIGLAAASYMRVPGSGMPLPNLLRKKFGSAFGLPSKTKEGLDLEMPKSIRDIFWEEMLEFGKNEVGGSKIETLRRELAGGGGWSTSLWRGRLLRELNKSIDPFKLSQEMNTRWAVAEERYRDLSAVNPVNRGLSERLQTISQKYSGKGGFVDNIAFQLEGLREQVRFGFFGADLAEETLSKEMSQMGFKSFLGRAGLLFATGFVAHGLITGGLLGSMESKQELRDIYSGRQLVEVGKGRFWEGAGTPWEGADPGQLRPHWYPIMMSRARQSGIWGWAGDEDRRSPLTKFLLGNFTHTLERETYYDRPAPISAPAFSNLPIIGPALGATIGQVFKPSKLMHVGEWVQSTDGNLQFADVYKGWKREPDYGQGAAGPGIPRSPYDPASTFSELNYQYRELAGLWGFAANTLQDVLTGDQLMAPDRPRLADSGMLTSYRRAFWDMSLGGGGPLGEIVRRVLPSFPKDIQRQNPIINNMPCIPAETEILGADGLLYTADKVVEGCKVVDHFGQEQIVEATTSYPVEELIELELTGSNVFPMKYSLEHPIWVYKRGFVQAQDLIKGDWVGFPCRPYGESDNKIVDLSVYLDNYVDKDYIYYGRRNIEDEAYRIAHSYNFNIRSIPIEIKKQYKKIYSICYYYSTKKFENRVSRIKRYWNINDLYFLLGVWAAEGSLQSERHQSLKLSGCIDDKWLSEIRAIFEKYEVPYSIQPARGRGIGVYSSAVPLYKVLSLLVPGNAHTKYCVPEIIHHDIPTNAMVAFIRGLAQGDGYFISSSRTRLGIRTTSRLLLYQIRNIFIDLFRTVPSITVDKTQYKDSYHLTYSGGKAAEVANLVGYPNEISLPDRSKSFYEDGVVYVRLKNVSRIQENTIVYGHCISNTHTFCTSLLSTHNTWLPASFKWGDPMSKTPYGEAVLPGPGYSALHPELQGIDPEDYPLVYRYDILAQVSPRSQEFRKTRDQLYQQRALGYLTPSQEAWIDRIDKVVQDQWNRKAFDRVDKNAIQLPGSSITQAAWFQAQEQVRSAVAPYEYLAFPGLRPFQKFLGDRDAVEQYEYERLYGTPVGFWNKPYRDWIRPSMYSLANLMGYEGKPVWRQEADAVNAYFDKVEFAKWMALAEEAKARGDTRAKISYEYQAGNTRMGVNPMGNPLSIYWSLPEEERAFFNAFAFAEGKDRDRILEMVPGDQAHLYKTLWSRIDQDDPSLWSGGSTSPNQQYLYRQYHQMNKSDLPPVDWVGYMEDTDIRDIKVRYLNNLGRELHDYGEWEQSLRKAYSQPHLEGSESFVQPGNIYRGAVEAELQHMYQEYGPMNLNVFTSNHWQGTTSLEYNDNRQSEIQSNIQGYLNV